MKGLYNLGRIWTEVLCPVKTQGSCPPQVFGHANSPPFLFAGAEVTPGGMGWGRAGMGESHWLVVVLSCQILSRLPLGTQDPEPRLHHRGGEGEERGAAGVASFQKRGSQSDTRVTCCSLWS